MACPARGTSLASGRLDRYLSVIVNVFKLASLGGRVPLLAELEDLSAFAAAVAQRRSDPSEFPGLEAMMPESRLIRMLNRPGVEVGGDLTVIAGDAEPQGILKRLALLVTDLYYDEEHDFVVNTANMSGGAARGRDAARIFRHKHADVSHFRYFHNVETSRRLAAGLLQPGRVRGRLRAAACVAVPPSSRGLAAWPERTGARSGGAAGHHGQCARRGRRQVMSIPSGWISSISRAAACARSSPCRTANGWSPRNRCRAAMAGCSTSSPTRHRVVPFAYDWRISLKDEAQRLAERILAELEQTERDNQPLSILAHSMGGLLTRALLAFRPEVWQRICQPSRCARADAGHADARLAFDHPRTGGAGEPDQAMLAALDFRDSKQEILDDDIALSRRARTAAGCARC